MSLDKCQADARDFFLSGSGDARARWQAAAWLVEELGHEEAARVLFPMPASPLEHAPFQ